MNDEPTLASMRDCVESAVGAVPCFSVVYVPVGTFFQISVSPPGQTTRTASMFAVSSRPAKTRGSFAEQ